MNQFTVTAPVAGFNGESCGVVFKDGAGRVNDGTKESRAAIEYFRRRGYTLASVQADGPEEPPSGSSDPGKAESDEPFDPSKHNAEDVIGYLDSLDTEDTDGKSEFERVIAAERDGKNRKTITEKGAAA